MNIRYVKYELNSSISMAHMQSKKTFLAGNFKNIQECVSFFVLFTNTEITIGNTVAKNNLFCFFLRSFYFFLVNG